MDSGQRYTIKSTLGSGGFGAVYRAYDAKLQRDVAIKRLTKGDSKDEIRAKLMEEARVLAALKHPNIVSIYDVSSHEDFDEIVMELVEGITLETFVKRHLLQPNDFRHIAAQILHGLAASHKEGVIHCDIKPENVMLCLTSGDQYELKVFDFGISEPMENDSSNEDFKLVGSVYVMAPELFDRKRPSKESDIYALGCLFYFLLTGNYPFVGGSSMQVMAAHLKGKYRPLAVVRPDLSKEFCDWIDSFIKISPTDRVPSCSAALEQLLKFEFSDKAGVFTLPTGLQLESNNSRVVRTLTRRSLDLESHADTNKTTRYLTNTITNSLAISKSAKAILEETEELEDPFSPKPELLPEKAEWYFTRGDAAKGPVTLDQLYKLVEDDKVKASSMVWHPHYGEWVHAFSCSELKPYFPEEELAAAEEEAEEVIKAPSILPAWFGTEVLVVILGALISAAFLKYVPDAAMLIFSLYAILVFATGLVSSRLYQFRASKPWFVACLVFPFVGDIVYAFVKKNTRSTICAIMLLLGGMSVALITLGEIQKEQPFISLLNYEK